MHQRDVGGGQRALWVRWGFFLLAVAAALWLAWAARAVWVPVAVALVIAVVLDPTVDRLENRGIPRVAATAAVFALFVAGGALALLLLSPGLSAQAGAMADDLSRLFPDPEQPDLVPAAQKLLERWEAHPILREALLDAAREGARRLSATFQRGSELAVAWAPNLIWFVVVPVLAFYILNDFHRIYAKGILLVPRRHRPLAQELIAEVSALLGKYLRGLAFLCVTLGLSIALLLRAYGNPYWQLLGFLGGLLYAIPVVGSLFTLGLVVLVTLVTATPQKALLVGGSLLLLSGGLFDQVITPRVLGRQVGLHPVLTIIALLAGYQVWGIGGMLVAVPLAASIQLIIVHLVPKLGAHLELRPLEELQKTEAETRAEHLQAEAETLDEHYVLHAVVENVEPDEEEAGEAGEEEPVRPGSRSPG